MICMCQEKHALNFRKTHFRVNPLGLKCHFPPNYQSLDKQRFGKTEIWKNRDFDKQRFGLRPKKIRLSL